MLYQNYTFYYRRVTLSTLGIGGGKIYYSLYREITLCSIFLSGINITGCKYEHWYPYFYENEHFSGDR